MNFADVVPFWSFGRWFLVHGRWLMASVDSSFVDGYWYIAINL